MTTKVTIVDMRARKSRDSQLGLVAVAAAIQKQIDQDFAPVWGVRASLRTTTTPSEPQQAHDADALVYVSDGRSAPKNHIPPALAYHFKNNAGIPCGFVFPDTLPTVSWSVALSHEILELLVDPDVNLLVPGPHPERTKDRRAIILRPYEVCDPVQASHYALDGVAVGDFVTPQYFTNADRHPSGRGRTHFMESAAELAPFRVLAGGYFTYFDLGDRRWRTFTANDRTSKAWLAARAKMGYAVRHFRRTRARLPGTAKGLGTEPTGADWPGLDGDGGGNGVAGWPGGGWP